MRMFRKVVSLLLLCSMMCYTMPIMAYTNDENIYIKMDSKGNPYRTIVTTTELDQNGNEETVEKEVSKELPFECNISYTLNGQSIDENELIGKSGKVTIKLDYLVYTFMLLYTFYKPNSIQHKQLLLLQ